MNQSVVDSIFMSMRFNRRYSAGFISKRQGIPLPSVRAALDSLVRGGVVAVSTSKADGRRNLYTSKQQQLQLPDRPEKNYDRVLVWFSCGAASAVALRNAIKIYGDMVVPVYCNTSENEHPDNPRFMRAIEAWLGVKVVTISSEKYKSIEEVAEKTGYMAGIKGARCTVELKKVPRFRFQTGGELHIFGFTSDKKERQRAIDFAENNHDLQLAWPLIDAEITKEECFKILQDAGIAIPELYLMGYKNNNCIGCFKATSAAYWNRIRVDFPEVFTRRAKQSRELGVRLTRVRSVRTFLDELPPEYMKGWKLREDLSCGPQCGVIK